MKATIVAALHYDVMFDTFTYVILQELGDGEVGIEWEEYEISTEQSLPVQGQNQSAKHNQIEIHRSSYK